MEPTKDKSYTIPISKSWIGKNLLLAAAAGITIYFLINKHPGYKWVCKEMFTEDKEILSYPPDLTTGQKTALKLGKSYNYLSYVRDHTPDTAVILLPSAEAFFPAGKKSGFISEPYNKLWALRFLYPRKLVVPYEKGRTSYLHKITHIALVNGQAPELLPVQLDFPYTDTIIQMNRSVK
ncbi:MAG TPA: hypothetical protein VM802_07490 [Chitinophaga sp.]|uniref:hypothetical protein n=1 Tax=Chitinophaga sp. TaxID=1869181 RepID=UPI002C759AAC|nr:hypothetical protein [Chitinophaga sp.]HVI44695.1 hypothetical protein [Chitinophaga sp.]